MNKSTYSIITIVSFALVIGAYMWLQSISYALPLPINKPENLTYIRVENYENKTTKFVDGKEDIVKIGEILNNSIDALEGVDKPESVQFSVFITDGNKSYTFDFYNDYIACEGHWFKNPYDATQAIRDLYGNLDYQEQAIAS